jgi:chromosome segregation ATPase
MYRRQDDLEVTLRSRESCITALQNDIGSYKMKLNEAETKLQQELSRSQTLEQELQVLKDKVSEVLEECQQKTDAFLHWQNEYAEVCMSVQTQWCQNILLC